MQSMIRSEIQKLAALLHLIQQDESLLLMIEDVAKICTKALQQGKKILFAGNGGSAADSQHFAAELTGRLRYDRPSMAAIALTTDTSALTAIANDYTFEHIFARQIEALGVKGDVFFGISTSGKSPNILKALQVAQNRGLITIGLTGLHLPLFTEHCDYVLNIPTQEVSKIQECHITIGHIICTLIEDAMYGKQHIKQAQTTSSDLVT